MKVLAGSILDLSTHQVLVCWNIQPALIEHTLQDINLAPFQEYFYSKFCESSMYHKRNRVLSDNQPLRLNLPRTCLIAPNLQKSVMQSKREVREPFNSLIIILIMQNFPRHFSKEGKQLTFNQRIQKVQNFNRK